MVKYAVAKCSELISNAEKQAELTVGLDFTVPDEVIPEKQASLFSSAHNGHVADKPVLMDPVT